MSIRNPVHVLLSLLVVGVWGLLGSRWLVPEAKAAEASPAAAQVLDEITVQRINIVDRTGKTRIVIANADRFPDPIVRGKPVPRSIRNRPGWCSSTTMATRPAEWRPCAIRRDTRWPG